MLDDRSVVRALRGEVTVAEVCAAAGINDAEFRRERDVIVALRGFWWSLNGRLQSIIVGEAAARYLPEGPLRDAFLTPNLGDERIVPPGSPYSAGSLTPAHASRNGHLHLGADDGATGSNNWAVGRDRTTSGRGILGSDPHQPFMLPGNWYEQLGLH